MTVQYSTALRLRVAISPVLGKLVKQMS